MQDFTNTMAVMLGNGHLITQYLRASLLIQTSIQKDTIVKAFARVIFVGFLAPKITITTQYKSL